VNVAPVQSPHSVKSHVSAAEWQTRVDLAACYRLVAAQGWDDLIFTHISAKVPGTEDFLINPFGLMFHEITASSLVKVDQAGNKLMDSPYDINPAGYTIHSAVHEVRHDVVCVLHTHTAAGVAVSAQKQGILPISQQSLFVLSSLAYHAYEGVALNHEEKARLQADLGENNFLMLHNHGLLTCGSTIADTFLMMFTFQRACEYPGDGAERRCGTDHHRTADSGRRQGDDRRRDQKCSRDGWRVGLASTATQTRSTRPGL